MSSEDSAAFQVFCFCGPGGSGKSTVCRKISEQLEGIALSVSTTTRKPRPGEVNGKDYYFVSPSEFERGIAVGEFLEYAKFNGNYYGTGRNQIDVLLKQGSDVLLDIDVQGVRQVKHLFPQQCVVVFVIAPSFAILKQRMLDRAGDTEESVSARLAVARAEIAALFSPGFSDYILVNDQLETALKNAESIISAERCRSQRIGPNLSENFPELG